MGNYLMKEKSFFFCLEKTYNVQCFGENDSRIKNSAERKLWYCRTDIQLWCIELNFNQWLPFGWYEFRTCQQFQQTWTKRHQTFTAYGHNFY